MTKSHKDPYVQRPNPTLTPHEIMAKVDTVNILNLVRDLTTYMPPSFKDQLQRNGYFSVKLGKYRVQVTLCERFEMNVGEYGKAAWLA